MSYKLNVKVLEARNLQSGDFGLLGFGGKSDPFVELRLQSGLQVFKTNVVKKTLNPVWNADFSFTCSSANEVLHLKVYDYDHISANDLLGETKISVAEFLNQGSKDLWVQLQEKGSLGGFVNMLNPLKRGTENWKRVNGEVHLQLYFYSVQPQFSQQTYQMPQQPVYTQPVQYPNQNPVYTTPYSNPQLISSPSFSTQMPQTYPQPYTMPQQPQIFPNYYGQSFPR